MIRHHDGTASTAQPRSLRSYASESPGFAAPPGAVPVVPSRRTTIGVPAIGSGTTATLIPATLPTLSPVPDPAVPARRHRGAANPRLPKATTVPRPGGRWRPWTQRRSAQYGAQSIRALLRPTSAAQRVTMRSWAHCPACGSSNLRCFPGKHRHLWGGRGRTIAVPHARSSRPIVRNV